MQPLSVMQVCSQINELQFILDASINVGREGRKLPLKSLAAYELNSGQVYA